MVAVSNSTLRHNVYETVYDIINAISFSGVGTVTVTASYNDEDQSLPVVAVGTVDVDSDSPTMNRSSWNHELSMLIDVWSKKKEHLDKITDQIRDEVDSYSFDGFFLAGVSESTALETPSNEKIHLKTITLTFMRR